MLLGHPENERMWSTHTIRVGQVKTRRNACRLPLREIGGKAVEEAGNLWRLVKVWLSLQVERSECRVSLD